MYVDDGTARITVAANGWPTEPVQVQDIPLHGPCVAAMAELGQSRRVPTMTDRDICD